MAIDTERRTDPEMTEKEKSAIVDDFKRYINKGQVSYLKAGHLDVIETRRKGIHFTDPVSGRIMIDAFSSAGCFNVGRHNQEIMSSLTTALDSYDMDNHNMLSPVKIAYAKKNRLYNHLVTGNKPDGHELSCYRIRWQKFF